jgi:hypothetical protein
LAFTSQEVKAKVYLAQMTLVIVTTAMGDAGTMMDYGLLTIAISAVSAELARRASLLGSNPLAVVPTMDAARHEPAEMEFTLDLLTGR